MSTLALVWRIGALHFAIDAAAVVEVLPPLAWRGVPGVPGWIRGLVTHRGRLVPLVDVAALLGLPGTPAKMANRVVVVRRAQPGAADEWPGGRGVESVVDLERLEPTGAGSYPGFESAKGRFLGPIVPTRWGNVQLVDPREIFTIEQAAVLTGRLREAAA
jgi:chemotaxis-related protein WspB